MPASLLFTFLIIAPAASSPPAASLPSAVASAVLGIPPASRCLVGFCPTSKREGPPPGLMFLATGLVGVGISGLARRGSRVPG